MYKYIKKMFEWLLDAIFPPLCIFCGKELHSYISVCKDCAVIFPPNKNKASFDGGKFISFVIAPYFYTDEFRKTMLRFKFYSRKIYKNTFARIINQYVQMHSDAKNADYIVYVPMHFKKKEERRYNQSEEIAIELSNLTSVPVLYNIIEKENPSKPLSTLQSRDRFIKVKDRFKINKYANTNTISGSTILLIDDIWTTGATANRCAELLVNAGAKKVIACVCAIREPLIDDR